MAPTVPRLWARVTSASNRRAAPIRRQNLVARARLRGTLRAVMSQRGPISLGTSRVLELILVRRRRRDRPPRRSGSPNWIEGLSGSLTSSRQRRVRSAKTYAAAQENSKFSGLRALDLNPTQGILLIKSRRRLLEFNCVALTAEGAMPGAMPPRPKRLRNGCHAGCHAENDGPGRMERR